MKQKRYQLHSYYLNASIIANLICALLICYLVYKYRQARKQKDQGNSTKPAGFSSRISQQTQQLQPSQQNPYIQSIAKINSKQVQTEVKDMRQYPAQLSHSQIPSELNSYCRTIKAKAVESIEQPLKDELQLEQQRNRFLQEKVLKMEEELSIAYRKIHDLNQRSTIQHQQSIVQGDEGANEMTRLRSELQFCQKRLALSYQTEKELKSQIEIYQRIGQHSLNHPYFNRLLAMNYKYKEIIFNMQKYLLEGPTNQLNFSFTEGESF